MIQKGVDKHREAVTDLQQKVQELLDNNKDAKKSKGAQQQYQRLKFNNADLKLRFDAVSFHYFVKCMVISSKEYFWNRYYSK